MSAYSIEPRCDYPTADGDCIRPQGHAGAHHVITRGRVPWVDTTVDVTLLEEDGTDD